MFDINLKSEYLCRIPHISAPVFGPGQQDTTCTQSNPVADMKALMNK